MLGAGSGPDSPAFMGLLREFLPSEMWLWLGWGCISSPALPLWEPRPHSTDSFWRTAPGVFPAKICCSWSRQAVCRLLILSLSPGS